MGIAQKWGVQICDKEKNVPQFVVVPVYEIFPTHCVFSFPSSMLIDNKNQQNSLDKNHIPLQIVRI